MKTISKASVAVCVLVVWVVGWVAMCVYQQRVNYPVGNGGRSASRMNENNFAATETKYRDHNSMRSEEFNVTFKVLGRALQRLNTSLNSTVNVLLLAYQRTGSSLLGEILTVRPDATYIFEPLIEISSRRNIYKQNALVAYIRQLYNCNASALSLIGPDRLADIILLRKVGSGSVEHEPEVGCRQSNVRVVKTIRLSMLAAKILTEDATLGIKVIHLVRDPRAILNSMATSDTWSDQAKTPRHQCDAIRRDLNTGTKIKPDRYIRVRYEDLVDNPLGVATELYKFLEVPLHKNLPFYLATHMEPERFYKYLHQDNEYFSTFRKSNYDNNSWMSKMTLKRRSEIEDQCWDVIQSLQYPDILSKTNRFNS